MMLGVTSSRLVVVNVYFRKTHQKSLDELQLCLDQENKSKIEVMRQKQAREQEVMMIMIASDMNMYILDLLNKYLECP